MTDGSLPLAATMACWLSESLSGRVSPDDFAAAVLGDDPQHLVVGLPASSSMPLHLAAGRLASLGATGARVALPAPGDPVGLGGPASFNAQALEASGAVLLDGLSLGLIASLDARTVIWSSSPASLPPVLDPFEMGSILKQTLLSVTRDLAELDVAAWQPEIPDLLLNLRHRPTLGLPPSYDGRRVETIERAVLCLEIVELALVDDGGATSAYEMGRRRQALAELDRSARRALVAACGEQGIASGMS